MGNICCCCHKSNINHGHSSEDISTEASEYLKNNGSSNISPSSINPSIFTAMSGPPDDCKYVLQASLGVPEDKFTVQISGMTCLADGRTVVTDSRNRIIKVFEKSFDYVYTRKTRKKVYEVVSVSCNNVAITEGNQICFYEIIGRYITKREKCFNVGKNSRNISYNGVWFAVRYGESKNSRIKILDNDGVVNYEIHRQLSTDQNVDNNPDTCSGSFVLDSNRDLLYLSNEKENCVSCIDFTGNIIWNSCSSVHIERPRCIDLFDSMIYVTDWKTGTVICMSLDGTHVIPVISHLRRPKLISFQTKQNRIVVYTAGNRQINVFQLNFIKNGN